MASFCCRSSISSQIISLSLCVVERSRCLTYDVPETPSPFLPSPMGHRTAQLADVRSPVNRLNPSQIFHFPQGGFFPGLTCSYFSFHDLAFFFIPPVNRFFSTSARKVPGRFPALLSFSPCIVNFVVQLKFPFFQLRKRLIFTAQLAHLYPFLFCQLFCADNSLECPQPEFVAKPLFPPLNLF